MYFDRLEKNLIDIIKEEQAKLGFRKEAIRLYYPLSSLNHFFEAEDSEAEMLARLSGFPASLTKKLGNVTVTAKKDRFCFHIPEDGSVYVTGYYKVTAPVDKTSDNEGVYTATVDKEYAKKGETVTVKVTTKTEATSGTDTITLTDVSGGNAAEGQEAAALNESLTFTYEMGAADSQATINVVNNVVNA